MKKYLKLFACLLTFGMIFSLTSCSDKDEDKPVGRDGKDILTFKIPSLNIEGVITAGSTKIEVPVSYNFNLESVKSVVPAITISTGATISPLENVPQDFSKEVKYTVTAQNGTSQDWTIVLKKEKYTPGIGKYSKSWLLTKEETNVANGAEASIATLGDKLVLSRSGVIISADGVIQKDGENNLIKLNMEGIVGNPTNAVTNVPFILTNDDKGNLIGCTLGAWSTPKFRMYKWTSVNAAPTLILDYEDANIAKGLGRKLVVVGDINANAYISVFDGKNDNKAEKSTHYVFAVKGGVVNPIPTNHTTGFNVTTFYQKLVPASATAVAPYYFGGPGNSNTASTVQYKNADGAQGTVILGPLKGTPEDDAAFKNGWGNVVSDIQMIKFNGRDYLGVIHYTTSKTGDDVKYHITLVDTKDTTDFTIAFTVEIPFTQNFGMANGNATAGLVAGKEVKDADGLIKMKLYGLFTGFGVIAYELTNEAI